MDVGYNRRAPVGSVSSSTTVEIQMPGLRAATCLAALSRLYYIQLQVVASSCGRSLLPTDIDYSRYMPKRVHLRSAIERGIFC